MSGKYGQLMGAASNSSSSSTASTNSTPSSHGVGRHEDVEGGDDAAAKGRMLMLSKKMHETRRFDSGDYFRGLIPEELAVGGGGQLPVANLDDGGDGGQAGQTTGLNSSEHTPQHLVSVFLVLSIYEIV
jgi:hypothetical protein